MNNDLISREALKKAITQNRNIGSDAVCDVLDIIDNAPTVECCTGEELHEKCDRAFENGFGRGYDNGYERGKVERPHGKWIVLQSCFECPYCGKRITRGNDVNYCPKCGAKMDGKEADNE